MMYYVMHPNLEVKAKVDAPSTEKARTTYLDYLERQGHINRANRQLWRRSMVAERMQFPEDVQADIDLSYGYEEAQPAVAPAFTPMEEIAPTEELGAIPVQEEVHAAELPVQTVAREAPGRLSPIQRLSLGEKL